MNDNPNYASKVLRKKGLRILAKGEQILNKKYLKNHKILETHIPLTSEFKRQFVEEDSYEKVTDLDELSERFGVKLYRYKSKKLYAGQHYSYKLVPIYTHTKQIIKSMPLGHYALYNPLDNAISLYGRATTLQGHTEWLELNKKRKNYLPEKKPSPINLKSIQKRAGRLLSNLKPSEGEVSYLEIEDGFLGVTDNGLLCCIEKPRFNYLPFIIICGKAGQGKSLLANSLEDIFFHKFKCGCINLNDIKGECKTRCYEWENDDYFKRELDLFHEPTVPKPCVYLHPTTQKDYNKVHMGESGFEISLPYKEVMKDKNLLNYNESWKMSQAGSGLQFANLIHREGVIRRDGLIYKKTLEDCFEFIDLEITDKAMNRKIKAVMSDIFNSKIIDTSSGKPSKWILDFGDYKIAESPWNICLASNLFPVLITQGIRDESWYALWIRYVLTDITRFCSNLNITLEKNKQPMFGVMCFMDEIAEIVRNKVTKEIMEKTVRECRKEGIGLTIVPHFYNDLPDSIKMHQRYLFVYNTNEKELLLDLKTKYNFSKEQIKDIPKLQQFQCYAVGDFILYDTDGNTFSNNNKPVKLIRVKPPNARHKG